MNIIKKIFYKIRQEFTRFSLKLFNNHFILRLLFLINPLLRINFNEKYVKSNKLKIFFSREKRLYLFVNGIKFRLKKLEKEYLIYRIKFHAEDVIIDVGSNIGEFSFLLKTYYKLNNILCVEADPFEYATLKKNTAGLNYEPLNLGAFNEDGEKEFFLNNDHGDSSFNKSNKFDSISIKVRTLDSIIKEKEIKTIKLVKLEAEGFEYEVLEGLKNSLNIIEYFSVDCGPERDGENTIKEVSNYLFSNNFSLVEIGEVRKVLLFKNNLF